MYLFPSRQLCFTQPGYMAPPTRTVRCLSGHFAASWVWVHATTIDTAAHRHASSGTSQGVSYVRAPVMCMCLSSPDRTVLYCTALLCTARYCTSLCSQVVLEVMRGNRPEVPPDDELPPGTSSHSCKLQHSKDCVCVGGVEVGYRPSRINPVCSGTCIDRGLGPACIDSLQACTYSSCTPA
mgnify:CR=1 FL=1